MKKKSDFEWVNKTKTFYDIYVSAMYMCACFVVTLEKIEASFNFQHVSNLYYAGFIESLHGKWK